jgi:hypothetical protein
VFQCPSDPYRTASNRTYAANAAPSPGNGGAPANWTYPFGRYNDSSGARMGAMDYRTFTNTPDIILVGERPYDIGQNPASGRGYVGIFSYSGMDSVPGWIHKKNTGANYLMGSGAVRFFLTTEVPIIGSTNYWLISDN